MSSIEVMHKCSIVGLGGAVSVIGFEQLQSILGISLLAIQLGLVLVGLGVKIAKYIKAKKTEGIEVAIAEAQGEIDGLKQELAEIKKRRGING